MRSELHPQHALLLVLDHILAILAFCLLGLGHKEAIIIGSYIAIVLYIFITNRTGAYAHLLVASAIALLWVLIANAQYGYNSQAIHLFGLNAFPLFAWATGLFMIYELYAHWEHYASTTLLKFVLFLAIYWTLLIGAETIAYHAFNIKNLATATRPGLPLCDCLHAPRWMQAAYLLLGPIYFTICLLFGLENPHKLRAWLHRIKSK